MELTPTNLGWLASALIGYGMVCAVLRTLAARVDLEVRRHKLIIASRNRRAQYFRDLADMGHPAEVVGDEPLAEPADAADAPPPPLGSIGPEQAEALARAAA